MRDYDDDSDSERKINKVVGDSVKRVGRGARRMSMAAAGNMKNVAAVTTGNVKKVAGGAVKTVASVKHGAESVIKKKGKKKKKKDKDKDKKKKKKERGRSESPRRSNNAKPPVTKPGVLRSLFSPKRWRSASPAISRGKSRKVVPEEEPAPLVLPPDPAVQVQQSTMVGLGDPAAAAAWDGMMNNNHASEPAPQQSLGMSIRSLSSAQRMQRDLQQQKIERDNKVPFFSVLINSTHFLKYCDIVFDLVDTNGDETVDDMELYAGLLLIHLKLGCFLGPAACKPLSRERCGAMFTMFDSTNSGGLDRVEFRRVMMVLFANVLARVLVQLGLTLLIVPLCAKSFLRLLTLDTDGWWDYWTKPKYLRRLGEELTLEHYVDWRVTSVPSPRRTFFTKLYLFFRIGSDEFWETFPLTFLTVVLGLVIAPVALYYFDDLFQLAVDWKETRRVKTQR